MFRMDTENDSKIPICGDFAALKNGRVVVGARQLRKALASGRAVCVFLAKDADPALTEPIAALCRQKQVRCVWVAAMAELGRACGIDVGAAAAAVVA